MAIHYLLAPPCQETDEVVAVLQKKGIPFVKIDDPGTEEPTLLVEGCRYSGAGLHEFLRRH